MARKTKAGIEFVDPPEKRGALYDWVAVAKALRSKPGEWACVFEGGKTSTVTAIKAGGISALRPADGYEVSTRNNTYGSPRTCDLYVRYVPKENT